MATNTTVYLNDVEVDVRTGLDFGLLQDIMTAFCCHLDSQVRQGHIRTLSRLPDHDNSNCCHCAICPVYEFMNV